MDQALNQKIDSLYDGRRGPGGRGVQLAFYAFYPVHMLVLALLAQFLS